MTGIFDKLNLRPFERRLVVAVGIALFIVVQLVYVWPHFGDVGKMEDRRAKGLNELKVREDEIAASKKLAPELAKLESEGLSVPPEDQTVEFMRSISSQSAPAGVTITANSKPTTRTNQFFLEQSQQITTLSDEAGLINFLYNLGSGNSLIRVRDLTVRPDQTRQKLSATVKLIASYQKKAPVRAAAPGAKAPAAAPPPKAAAPKPVPAPKAVPPAPGVSKPAPKTPAPGSPPVPRK
jgi:hypothetical protein